MSELAHPHPAESANVGGLAPAGAHSDATPATKLEKGALLLAVILPIVGAVAGIALLWNRLVGWQELLVFGLFYALTVLGIGVGFHRMLTHRSFDAPAPVRFFFLALGSMALQGSAIEWAATHNKHHAKSDKEGDPHSPLEGFWSAHLGWLFKDRMIKNGIWAKPYLSDPVARVIDRTVLVWAVLGFVLPGVLAFALGGSFWLGVLWGGVVRVGLVHHVTWSVNSVCHTFGRRMFHSHDQSRNEWIVGLLGFGEGWHNNHHAFPKAAYHGMKWYQFDVNAYVIRLLKWTRLARNVWMPSKEAMASRRVTKKREDAPAPEAS